MTDTDISSTTVHATSFDFQFSGPDAGVLHGIENRQAGAGARRRDDVEGVG